MFKIMGITDSVTSCDCCGRTNLKCTVELENEAGEIVHYGRDCAGAAVHGGKNRKNTEAVEFRARVVKKCRDALPAILTHIEAGHDMAAVKKLIDSRVTVTFGTYTDTGNKMPLRIYALGSNKPGVELTPEAY